MELENMTQSMTEEETHILILWQNARHKEHEILADIQRHLTIIDCIEIRWNKRAISKNFSRFYGIKLDNNSFKEKECGTGPFLVIVVKDKKPHYDFVETSRGHEYVNTTLFSLKTKYRHWTHGGHKIHATNSPKETRHDLSLLLDEETSNTLLAERYESWDGSIKKITRDLTGTDKWKNLKEIFYVLNNTIDYVILRNFEDIPDSFSRDVHGDIDILVSHYEEARIILNGTAVFCQANRVYHQTHLSNDTIFFDLRHVGDNYYCIAWERDILATRVLHHRNIYIPDTENHFYSLVYHALVHKHYISSDYYNKTYGLFCQLPISKMHNIKEYNDPFDLYYTLLKKYMRHHRYFFIRPLDPSVVYNTKLLDGDDIIQHLSTRFFYDSIIDYMCHRPHGSGFRYYKATREGNAFFIKYACHPLGDTAQNEITFSKRLSQKNQSNFLSVQYYGNYKGRYFIIYSWLEGRTLKDILQQGELHKIDRKRLLVQLKTIASTLIEEKCVHRDIHPGNIFVTQHNNTYLLDLQFCTDYKNYKEIPYIRENPFYLENLGESFALGRFQWDDIFSLKKVAKQISFDHTCHQEYIDLLSFLDAHIGKHIITLSMQKKSRIPFIKIKKKRQHTSYRLLGIIPIWKTKHPHNSI